MVLDLCCQDEGTSLALYTLQNLRRSGEGLDQVRFLTLLPQNPGQELLLCSKAGLGGMENVESTVGVVMQSLHLCEGFQIGKGSHFTSGHVKKLTSNTSPGI